MFEMNLAVACLSVTFFAGGVVGYLIGRAEGPSPSAEIHSGPDDLERRARRVQ